MKIIDKRNHDESSWFSNMVIGATFLDDNDNICIKVSRNQWFNLQTNQLIDVPNGAIPAIPYEYVKVELVIRDLNGYDKDWQDNGKIKL